MRRFANRAGQPLGRLASELDYTDAAEVTSGGLHEFIDAPQDRFNRVGDTITATFFRQGQPSIRRLAARGESPRCIRAAMHPA